MSWGDIINYIYKTNVSMGLVLAIIIFFVILIIWVYQRSSDNDVDVMDLVCVGGRLDEKKFARFGAWIVSTWGFVYLIMDGKFSEWYFAGYMAVWTGSALMDKYLNRDIYGQRANNQMSYNPSTQNNYSYNRPNSVDRPPPPVYNEPVNRPVTSPTLARAPQQPPQPEI